MNSFMMCRGVSLLQLLPGNARKKKLALFDSDHYFEYRYFECYQQYSIHTIQCSCLHCRRWHLVIVVRRFLICDCAAVTSCKTPASDGSSTAFTLSEWPLQCKLGISLDSCLFYQTVQFVQSLSV